MAGVGVYPGSFNPLTRAHLAIAEAAVGAHDLHRLDFVISKVALGKEHLTDPVHDERLIVLERAAATRPWMGFHVTEIQLVSTIAHGYDLRFGADQQKLAVNSGIWPLYRYDPRRVAKGEPPLVIDAPPGRAAVAEYMRNETRFRMVEKIDPERFRRLAVLAKDHAARRVALYEQLSRIVLPTPAGAAPAAAGPEEEAAP